MRKALFLLLSLAVAPLSAATLITDVAGFAGTKVNQCFIDSGTGQLNLNYNIRSCRRHGVVEVDVSGTGVMQVASATLTLFDGEAHNSTGSLWSIDVHGYEGDGVVTGSDFNVGDYYGTVVWDRFASDAAAFQIDVTDLVNAELALGASIIGFNLRPTSPYYCSSCASAFVTFDGGIDGSPPILTFTPVPIPAAVWLFGSALGLLGWMRIRGGNITAD